MANRNKKALELTERSRTSNGAKRSGQFELWITYTTRFRWPGARTHKVRVRRYETREMAEKVGLKSAFGERLDFPSVLLYQAPCERQKRSYVPLPRE